LSGLRSLMFVLAAGLFALGAEPARAQTQLDEGKTAPQLFSSACSACHKSPRGLTKETSASTLASFLRAHYTTGREQAGLLAAYVLAAGSGTAEARGQPSGPGRPDRSSEPRPPSAVEPAKPPEEQGAPLPAKPVGQATTQAEPQTPAGEGRRAPRTEDQGRPPARAAAPNAPARGQTRGADARPVVPAGPPARTDDIAD
jgi:hypothetical protein